MLSARTALAIGKIYEDAFGLFSPGVGSYPDRERLYEFFLSRNYEHEFCDWVRGRAIKSRSENEVTPVAAQ